MGEISVHWTEGISRAAAELDGLDKWKKNASLKDG